MFYIIIIILNIILLSGLYISYKKKLKQKIDIESKKYIEENVNILKSAAVAEIADIRQQRDELAAECSRVAEEYVSARKQFLDTNKQLQEITRKNI